MTRCANAVPLAPWHVRGSSHPRVRPDDTKRCTRICWDSRTTRAGKSLVEAAPMRFVLFYHSLLSDWNHGNAHFLRGVVGELMSLGHDVRVMEPSDGWSLTNLRGSQGEAAVEAFHTAYPQLRSELYELETLDLEPVLDAADVVIVHEWNDPVLVKRIGDHRRRFRFQLLFPY